MTPGSGRGSGAQPQRLSEGRPCWLCPVSPGMGRYSPGALTWPPRRAPQPRCSSGPAGLHGELASSITLGLGGGDSWGQVGTAPLAPALRSDPRPRARHAYIARGGDTPPAPPRPMGARGRDLPTTIRPMAARGRGLTADSDIRSTPGRPRFPTLERRERWELEKSPGKLPLLRDTNIRSTRNCWSEPRGGQDAPKKAGGPPHCRKTGRAEGVSLENALGKP